jgi:hypothetical protein
MAEQDTHDAATQSDPTAAGELLAQKLRDVGENVSREIRQLGAEASQRTSEAIKGAGLLAGAGGAGMVAAVALAALPVMALRRVMPGWAIAVGTAGAAGTLAAVLARRGLANLAAAAPGDDVQIKEAARDAVRAVV